MAHLFGHLRQSLYHDLQRVIARVPYKAPRYELIQYFARGHPLAQVSHYGLANCLFQGFGLIVELYPHGITGRARMIAIL
jgi:hypothetical protein